MVCCVHAAYDGLRDGREHPLDADDAHGGDRPKDGDVRVADAAGLSTVAPGR